MLALLLGALVLLSAGKALHVLFGRRSVEREPAVRWAAAAWLCACVGIITFALNLFIGFGRGAQEVCAAETGTDANAFVGLGETLFPRSYTCRWADGTATDLIPLWVNPVLFAALIGVLGCTATAAVIAIKRAGSGHGR